MEILFGSRIKVQKRCNGQGILLGASEERFCRGATLYFSPPFYFLVSAYDSIILDIFHRKSIWDPSKEFGIIIVYWEVLAVSIIQQS